MIRIVAGPDLRPPPMLDEPALLTLVLAIVCIVQDADVLNEDITYTLTSWWRSTQRNQEVGGVPNSFHLTGRAIDVTASATGLNEFFSLGTAATSAIGKVALRWRRFGLQAVVESDHVHLELDPI